AEPGPSGVEAGEVDLAIERGEVVRAGAPGAGIQILHQDRSGRGAIRLPQLLTGRGVEGVEEHRAAHHGAVDRTRAGRPLDDVLEEEGPGRGSVRPPELAAGR